jgi:large subunit ribosomal protein L4
MKLTIKNTNGEAQGELEVKFAVIEDGRGTQAVHDTVVAQMAARRSGTASTKTMGEVAGSGKKPWRQKGTGMARAGSFASPLWRGGGVVFGPKPRDFTKKVNRSTRQLALRKAVSERLKAGDVVVVDQIALNAPRTRELVSILTALDLSKNSLLVVAGEDKNLLLASRNLARVEFTTPEVLNTYQVLRFDKLLVTRSAFEKLDQRLAE